MRALPGLAVRVVCARGTTAQRSRLVWGVSMDETGWRGPTMATSVKRFERDLVGVKQEGRGFFPHLSCSSGGSMQA